MKKQTSLILYLILSVFLIAGCSQEEPPTVEKEDKEVSKDPFLNFDVEYIIKSTRNKEVIIKVREMATDYRDEITHIRMTAEEKKNTIKSKIGNDIKEQETQLSNQRDLYSEHCYEHSINQKSDFECEATQDKIDKAKSKISEHEQKMEKEVETIEKNTEEKLNDAKANFVEKMRSLQKENDLKLPSFFKSQ